MGGVADFEVNLRIKSIHGVSKIRKKKIVTRSQVVQKRPFISGGETIKTVQIFEKSSIILEGKSARF